MAYITPTNSKWVTWYDVSQALQERTGDYTQNSTQFATKAYIIANFDKIHLEKLNTSKNSINTSYLNNQFVKWADVEAIEYVFYIDTIGNTAQTITKDYYAYSQTFVIYSYKNIYKNGNLVTANIPVTWHYDSSQTGWTTNSPTGGTASATTITLAIPENKTTAQINYNWSAVQNEGRTSGAKRISIKYQHKAKYGTIAWNPSGDIATVSTATTIDKGIVVTGNFNDNISDSQGTDAANILTAVTISSSETWVTGITFSLTNSNYKFPMYTSETVDRVTTITLTINDPRLTLSGPATFKITQRKRVVTFDSYAIRVDSSSTNAFGNFTCMGGSRNYTVHSYAKMYYDGTLQNTVNIPYTYTPLGWTTISNTSMETFRSIYNSTNGTGKGSVTVGESPTEGSGRNGNVNFSQNTYSSTNVNVSISQDKPCMVYHFDISPTSITVPGPTSGTSGITVTSYKVKNGHTESPIAVGYTPSTGSNWITVTGNSSPSASATTNTLTYAQNLGLARNGLVTYTQNQTNENGTVYNKQLTVNQEDGFINVYRFFINSTEGATSGALVNLSQFGYAGGSQTITLKSYAEVHIGTATGAIDHYEAVNWSSSSCNWLTVSPSSGSGINNTTGTTTVTTTASAQSESSTDNARCCDIVFTQSSSGKKITVHGCQEKNQTGYTYTFTVSNNSLSFEACSSTLKTSTITSYRDKTRNGSVVSGNRTNIGYSVDTVDWATATSNNNPSSSATTTTITANSNSNNPNPRNSYFQYTQLESNKTVRIDVSQSGATCSMYDRGPLEINIGNGYKTSDSKSIASGSTTINVSFSSPVYNSLCGLSGNTKCDDSVESYRIDSKPSWVSSNIGNSYSTSDDVLTISASDVDSERTGTVVYSNGYTTASIVITQARGVSYTYTFKVKGTSSSKADPNYETSSTLSFSNIGASQIFSIDSYRVNSLNGAKEEIGWYTYLPGTKPSYLTYTTGGTGSTNSVSVIMSENTSSTRSHTIQYIQNNSAFRVDIPLSQHAVDIGCYLYVTNGSTSFGVSGGTATLKIDSYETVNGSQGGNKSWTASITGCGSLSRTSGDGGNGSSSNNQTVLTVPSGTTACSGTITITNNCGQSKTVSYSRSAESYTYYFEVKAKPSSKVDPSYETATSTSVSNTGSTFNIPVKSYRVRGSDSGIEAVNWTATLDSGTSSAISFSGSGTGTTSTASTVNNSTTVDENFTSARNFTVKFVQSSSNYRVNVPISQAASTETCNFEISDTSYSVDVNGGTKKITVTSNSITNGHITNNINWNASISSGCGTISPTSGTGDGSFTITMPSGVTSCSSTVTVSNGCSSTNKTVSVSRSAGDVKWSDPAENTTKTVSATGITFTAYADTTGLTASQCEVYTDPTSPAILGTLQGTGTGSRAVWVTITVPTNTSTNSRNWNVTIKPK